MEDKNALQFKQKVHERCKEAVDDKVSLVKKTLQDLIESTGNETKSSAGDKYETGRAMLQIEQDNVRKQLREALERKAVFDKIETGLDTTQVANGSLVKTDKGYLYVSVALGKLNIDGLEVIALSPQSPLGSKLIGLKITESAEMNGTKYTIESIA